MKFTKIKETCLYVADLESTRQFYQDKLRLQLISLVKGRHVFFSAGASVLLCFITEQTEKETLLPPHGAHGKIHFALEVEIADYQSALKEVKDAGIKILHEHEWKRGLHSFYFHDPDKHVVEIIQDGVWDG